MAVKITGDVVEGGPPEELVEIHEQANPLKQVADKEVSVEELPERAKEEDS